MKKIILIIFALAIVGILVALTVMKKVPVDDNQGVACTEEALMCPDGSGVGRTGTECKFSPCPNSAEEYTGKLLKNGENFFLVIGASENSPFEVNYALPLKFRVSNAVADLVDKQVTARGKFIEGATLEVETMELSAEGNEVKVGVGETKFMNGVKITLHGVVQDSRCPIDVTCIQAGAITARVTLKSDTDTETFNMPSDEVPHQFDSYKVSIVDVNPPRLSTEETNPQSYRVTFKVENL